MLIGLVSVLMVSSTACQGKRAQKTSPAAEAAVTSTAQADNPTPASPLAETLTETPENTPTPEAGFSGRGRNQPTPTATLGKVRPVTPTPTPPKPALAITPFSSPGQAIALENAGRLIELARWGKGKIHQMLWSPDGRILAVAFSTGIYFYDRDTREQAGWINTPTDPFTELIFSPDGTMLAAGFMDSTAGIWEAPGGELIQSFPNIRWRIGNRLALTPDGAFLIILSASDISVWRVAERDLVFHAAAGYHNVAISPDYTSLAVSADNALKFYPLGSGEPLLNLELQGQATSLAFSPDGKTLALALDRTVQVLRASDGKRMQTLGLADDVSAEASSRNPQPLRVAFSPGGATLAAWSDDRRTAQFWRVEDGRPLLTLEGKQVAFSADGALLAAWSNDDPILRAWRAADGRLAYTLASHEFGVRSAIFSPDGNTLATISTAGTLRLWNARNGRWVQNLGVVSPGFSQGEPSPGEQSSIIFSPSEPSAASDSLAAVLSPEGELTLWQAADGRKLETLFTSPAPISDLAFTPDGQFLLYRTDDGGCRLRAADGSQESCFSVVHGKTVSALSPDGSTAYLTHSDWETERGVPFWLKDTTAYSVEVKLTLPFSLTMASFSADGLALWLASPHGDIAQYNVKNGSPLRRFKLVLDQLAPEQHAGENATESLEIERLFLAPDGETLVSLTSDQSAVIWNLSDGSLRARLDVTIQNPEQSFVVFSTDQSLLALSDPGQPVRLYRLDDGAALQTLFIDEGYSSFLAFLPGDEILASGSQNRLRLWRISNGKLLGRLSLQAWIAGLATSPDGRLIATVTEDGVIQIWGVAPER